MKRRVLMGVLLAALAVVAVPIEPASADHVTDPCNDPSAEAVGPAQTGSFQNPDYDVWTDPGGGHLPRGEYVWVVNADAPIRVTSWIEISGGGCVEFGGTECIETHRPYTCHRTSSVSPQQEWIVIEHGRLVGTNGAVNYELVYAGADPL